MANSVEQPTIGYTFTDGDEKKIKCPGLGIMNAEQCKHQGDEGSAYIECPHAGHSVASSLKEPGGIETARNASGNRQSVGTRIIGRVWEKGKEQKAKQKANEAEKKFCGEY